MPYATLYKPGIYENPLTEQGRARTIAALTICCGGEDIVKGVPMRRDVLRQLMSPKAVSYWLEMDWLSKHSKVGKIELLALTGKGVATCRNSLAGGSNVPTRKDLVDRCLAEMTGGGAGYTAFDVRELEP